MEGLKEKVLGLLHILEDNEKLHDIKKLGDLDEVCSHFDLDRNVFERLLAYSKLQFDCGNYALSSELLKHYRNIVLGAQELPSSSLVNSIWGSLASSILNTEFDEAADVIVKLEDLLETAAKMSKREVLV